MQLPFTTHRVNKTEGWLWHARNASLIATVLVFFWANGPMPRLAFVMIAMFMIAASSGIAYSYVRKGNRLKLIEADWAICQKCGYCLRGLAENGRCPECARYYCLPELAVSWKQIYESTF
jgi:hypothetical protein